MANEVEQIKERLSIVDVVSSYVKLEKAGANMRARCPFHNEKTPSFFVSPTRNSYYCFGCSAKGDIFSFVQQFEGLDFMGALKTLAARAGVELVREDPKVSDDRAKLFAIMEAATQFFEKNLRESAPAQEYLRGRGVTPATSAHFRVGYAAPAWRSLHEHLNIKGFPDRLVALAGLIKEANHRYYDRFRGRIIFPIADSSGRVVAFSGRLFGGRPPRTHEKETVEEAKYLNSPETPLFSKSRVLYGFDKAKTSIRRNDFSIVVEGQMDLILSHQAGFGNTVALSGTALTAEHITALSRLSFNTVFAFDADRAGVLSSGRSAELALSLGMNVKVAALPAGKDPAEAVKESPEEWKRIIRESKHIIDFYLDVLSAETAEKNDLRAFRLKVQKTVLPFVARIGNRMDQAHFVSRIASRVNLAEAPIWDELKKVSAGSAVTGNTVAERQTPPEEPEISLLSRKDRIVRTLTGILLWQESEEHPLLDTAPLRARLHPLMGSALDAVSADMRDELVFEAEVAYGGNERLSVDTEELVRQLQLEGVRAALAEATGRLRRAEEKHEELAVKELLAECERLSKELAKLGRA